MIYKYIRIQAVSAPLSEVTNENSAYNKGVAEERALAESAPYLAERVAHLEWIVQRMRKDDDKESKNER